MGASRLLEAAIPCLAAGLLLSAGHPAVAQSERAVMRFADLNGGIRDWRAENGDAILVQGANGQWYRATFFAPCVGLRFAQAVAFVTDSLGNLDQFGSILVEGERCWFQTFERTNDPAEGPPPDVEPAD